MVDGFVIEANPLYNELVELYKEMPPQLQAAASYVLKNPKDVALMSMREQAQKAGVSHSTMVRLAHFLGLEGYEELRSLYIKALRRSYGGKRTHGSFADHGEHSRYSDKYSDRVSSLLESFATQIEDIGERGNVSQLSRASEILEGARNIFCVAAPAEQIFASHFVSSFAARHGRGVLPAEVEIGSRNLPEIVQRDDVVLVISLGYNEYRLVEILRRLSTHGVKIISITDNTASSSLSRVSSVDIAISFLGNIYTKVVKTYTILELLQSFIPQTFTGDIIPVAAEAFEVPISLERRPEIIPRRASAAD